MKQILVLCIASILLLAGCQGAGNTAEAETNEVLEKNDVAGVELTEFETENLKGSVVNEDLFKQSKITVLNLWGTFCGPCIDEMPELEAVSNAYDKKAVQVVGLLIDPENKEEGLRIVEQLSVTYENVLAKGQLKTLVADQFDYVPATLFVNEKGVILESFIPGSTTQEDLNTILETLVK